MGTRSIIWISPIFNRRKTGSGSVAGGACPPRCKRAFFNQSKVDTALDDLDVVWIRTDPPVDRTYIYTTLLLDLLAANVKVVNRPSSIRDWNEKLAALAYPELTPPPRG
ncbi:MAG: hypothetical protein CM1200mP41_14050 [Gammaproteobacteria bacterium]|nr:MAG: hypothetical protein CM1200mP41_14050 [Gammaproteobacteria bacterium]